MPKKLINITPELLNAIKSYAQTQKYLTQNKILKTWSFSRALNYVAYLGLNKLADLRLIDAKLIAFEFDVDKPQRVSRKEVAEKRGW